MKPVLVAAAMAVVLSGAAMAQQAGSNVSGIPAGNQNVLVVRGGDVYYLENGNALLPGDRIVTRPGTQVQINIPGCSPATMTGGLSFTVAPNTCPAGANLVSVSPTEVIGNVGGANGPVQLTAAGTAAGASGFPLLLPLAAAGTAGAAALATSNGTPASP